VGALCIHAHLLRFGRCTPAGPQVVREFDAGSIGQMNVLCETADAAVGQQARRFRLEEVLPTTTSTRLVVQPQRPAQDVRREVDRTAEPGLCAPMAPMQLSSRLDCGRQ
jgi:hypothetical protein